MLGAARRIDNFLGLGARSSENRRKKKAKDFRKTRKEQGRGAGRSIKKKPARVKKRWETGFNWGSPVVTVIEHC